jgi:hypothetical protein
MSESAGYSLLTTDIVWQMLYTCREAEKFLTAAVADVLKPGYETFERPRFERGTCCELLQRQKSVWMDSEYGNRDRAWYRRTSSSSSFLVAFRIFRRSENTASEEPQWIPRRVRDRSACNYAFAALPFVDRTRDVASSSASLSSSIVILSAAWDSFTSVSFSSRRV